MPNRGELPIPALGNRNPARSQATNADADAWAVIGFCAIGGLMTFCMALASVGIAGYPAMLQLLQMP